MPYEVKLTFGLQTRTKLYRTVNEARRSADRLATSYAGKFGRATATVLSETGEDIYIRVCNAATSTGLKKISG